MGLSVWLPIIIAFLGLLYLSLFGQQSIAEWRSKNGRTPVSEASSTDQVEETLILENLPTPDYPEFIGRSKEFQRILAALRPYPLSQHSVVAIDGVGGVGKSALALRVARHFVQEFSTIPPEERFFAIIWTSAKEQFLTADGTQARAWRHRSLDDIFETIAICLGREDITRVDQEQRVSLVQKALKQQRTLLIIDNMETIDDEAVYSFLRELPAPTKAVITSRYRVDVAMTITLAGMEDMEALELLEIQLGDGGTQMSSAQRKELARTTGNLPLALVWSAARLRLGESFPDIIDDVSRGEGDLSTFAFEAIWRKLDSQPDLLLVLQAVSLLPHPATLDLVFGASELSDRRATRQALNVLARLSLVARSGDTWTTHQLVRNFALQRVSDKGEFLSRATVTLTQRLNTLIGDERVKAISAAQYGAVDPDRQNLLYLIDWCYASQNWLILRDLVARMGYYLHARGLWIDAVRVWECGVIAARECQDVPLEARFTTYLGYMAYFMDNYNRSQFYLDQAVRLIDRAVPSYQLGSLLRLEGYLIREQGRHTAALARFEEGLDSMRACQNTHGICRLLNDIGETKVLVGDFSGAELAAQEALARAESSGELIERVRSIVVLATRARMVGDLDRAVILGIEGKAQALDSGWWDDAGKAALELSRSKAAQGRRREAIELAREAFDYFERIGNKRGITACEESLSSLSRRT